MISCILGPKYWFKLIFWLTQNNLFIERRIKLKDFTKINLPKEHACPSFTNRVISMYFFDFFVLRLFCRWREISVDWFFSFWHNYLQREEPLWNEKCRVYNNFCTIRRDYTTSRDMISLTDRQFAAYLFRRKITHRPDFRSFFTSWCHCTHIVKLVDCNAKHLFWHGLRSD